MNPTQIARVCHEANRAFCLAFGDTSQPSWSEAPEWLKTSCVLGVEFRLLNPEATPADMHANWMKDRLAAGWSLGPVKDVEKLTHPNLRPYEELPAEQRAKDYIFSAIVKALIT